MSLRGRYFSARDILFTNSISAELMGDIIENIVTVYKICPFATNTNIYGEASDETGKVYLSGVEISAILTRQDVSTISDDFGPDRDQQITFALREKMCRQFNLYPDIGDLIKWNNTYFEIDNPVRNQLLGGIGEKSYSILCSTHYTRLSSINIKEGE